MAEYPAGRSLYAEMAAQAAINCMENLYNLGRTEEAWNRLTAFKEESKSSDFHLARDQWESRMNYLCARIMLDRTENGGTSEFIDQNLEIVRKGGLKKREGCLLRLLGEFQIKRGESGNAISTINHAIPLLKEVGNPPQLWQAHASLGSAFEELGRLGEAREQWGAAAQIIQNTAKGLSDQELREGFLKAEPIRQILAKAQ